MSVKFTYRYHHPAYTSRRHRDERYDRVSGRIFGFLQMLLYIGFNAIRIYLKKFQL